MYQNNIKYTLSKNLNYILTISQNKLKEFSLKKSSITEELKTLIL